MSDLRKKTIAKSKEHRSVTDSRDYQLRQEWLNENRTAIESSNAWVEKHGLPLARFRQF
jgi:post-segregation antitoxin (ccd killing protein)